MKRNISRILLLISLSFALADVSGQNVPIVRKAKYFDKTPPLREMELIQPSERDQSWKDGIIPNEEIERQRNNKPYPLPAGKDPVLQEHFGQHRSEGPFANFEGTGNLCQCYPPDTDGDVGPNHYFQMINLSFQIFDKAGNSLYGPASNSTLWSGFIGSWTGTNDGDPILLYDELADRWVASQFAIDTYDSTFWELIAVSETGDPLGSYYRYAFQYPVFNDYPKMGVWPDAYYLTYNMFGADYRRVAVSAHERDAMLAGNPDARMVLFDLPQGSEPWSMLPADFDGSPPPDGAPNYVIYAVDDAFGEGDLVSIWEFDVDWNDPQNSTFQEAVRLDVEPFDSELCPANRGRCIHQPEGAPQLESLSTRLMFRLQYRNFGEYQAMVTNHTVDVDGNGHAGIRWYEMRDLNDGNGWQIYQQGTYAPDSHHRWMGSIAMDGRGYIALGFSVSSVDKYPSIHYTGRSPDDPLGEMTFYEEEVIAGSGVQTGDASRWGDYSMMSVDPSNDTSFWFTTEYVEQTGATRWQTRIAGFTLVKDVIAPAPVTDLSATALTTNAIELNWTATGNNGNEGTAFLYDIRYSTEPITVENFYDAQPAEGAPEPSEAGTYESFILYDLEFSTAYYFALKVRDRQFNFSPMSNTAGAVTPGAPELDPEGDAIVQKLFEGSVGTRPFTLANNGQSDIYYRIIKDTLSQRSVERQIGYYADETRMPDLETEARFKEMWELSANGAARQLGDVLGVYENSTDAITGLVWVDGELYMVDMQSDQLIVYDTSLQQIIRSDTIHDNPFGMTWDGQYLWIGNKVGNIYAYNPDGTPAGGSFSCPFAGYASLSWDGEGFLTNFIIDIDPDLYRVDHTGAIMNTYSVNINRSIWQLVHVPEHHMGNIWMTNNNGIIAQLKIDGDEVTERLSFSAPFTLSYALGHDHNDLWYGKIGGILYRIDDGVDELRWLSVSPEKETIPSGGQLDVDLTFDTRELEYGNHLANIVIFSNDQDEPEIRIPVELMITSIDLGVDTSFCGHLSVEVDAGEGFAGYAWSDGSASQVNLVDSAGYGLGSAIVWVDVTDHGGVVDRDSINITFNDCTTIYELTSGTRISIYPNPNTGLFEVIIQDAGNYLRIEVVDLLGQQVYSREVKDGGGGILRETIDLRTVAKGTYLVKITDGRSALSEKLFIR